jgi:hypothetical protein
MTSDEVVRYLKDVDAPPEVLKALRAIPPEEYANRAEV